MTIWKRTFGAAPASTKQGKALESVGGKGAEGTTFVVLSNDNMEYFTRHGGSVEALDAAARDYLRCGKYDDALRCCRILSMHVPMHAGPWLLAGMALYERDASTWRTLRGQWIPASKPPPFGEAHNAIQYFDRALELDGDNHLAWFYKGSSLAMIGQFTRDAPKVKEGLECLSQALRTRPGDEATKQAIRDFRNLYATLQDRSSRRQEAEAVCDVCSFPINFADGYGLTTKQVVPTVAYWESVLKGQLQPLLNDDPEAAAALCRLVVQQASRSTGWLVCEACADLFQFDRASAKEYAVKRRSPPDAGPLPDHEDALVAALAARLKLKEKSA